MSKGGYIGGSTVIRAYASRSRRLRKGLLALERAELERRKAMEPAKAAVEAEPSPVTPPVTSETPAKPGHAVPRHVHHRQVRALRAAHRERRRLAMETAWRAGARRPADKPSTP